MAKRWRIKSVLLAIALVAALVGASSPALAAEEIRIGFLSPLTGGMAKPGLECKAGFEMFWDQVGNTAGGRPVRVIYADSQCNPDVAMTQARRLVHQEKVHLLAGPLCGHAGKAVAQVSQETGVPLIIYVAGADELTKWERFPRAVRTGISSSQDAHPFGEWLYKEAGLRNVTFMGQDYTFGQEKTLGAVATYTALGGKVAKLIWVPMGTNDYGPLLAGIPADSDGVVATVVGTGRIRLAEQWFDFGYDRKFKIYGLHWLQTDALDELDDRTVGLVSQALPYAQGIDTPENKAFMDAYISRYKAIPSYLVEMAYTGGLFAKTAIDAVNGKVEDADALINAVRKAKVAAPRGPVSIDDYGNAVHDVYICQVKKVNIPKLGDVKINVPLKRYENVSQFWTWTPEEFLARGPYKR